MPAKWQRIEIDLPDDFTPEQRAKAADLIIDHIIRRTESGKDKFGDRFPKYSDSYATSLDFKIAGKSRSRIDLKLSGDMLASIELLKDKKGQIVIGFEKGSEENARADGNIRGTYGKPTPNPALARDFLGIEDIALRKIVREIAEE